MKKNMMHNGIRKVQETKLLSTIPPSLSLSLSPLCLADGSFLLKLLAGGGGGANFKDRNVFFTESALN
jgi:hypothetical protein